MSPKFCPCQPIFDQFEILTGACKPSSFGSSRVGPARRAPQLPRLGTRQGAEGAAWRRT